MRLAGPDDIVTGKTPSLTGVEVGAYVPTILPNKHAEASPMVIPPVQQNSMSVASPTKSAANPEDGSAYRSNITPHSQSSSISPASSKQVQTGESGSSAQISGGFGTLFRHSSNSSMVVSPRVQQDSIKSTLIIGWESGRDGSLYASTKSPQLSRRGGAGGGAVGIAISSPESKADKSGNATPLSSQQAL